MSTISIPPIPYRKEVLGNGLTVIIHRCTVAPLAAVEVMYHVGSKNEKPGRTGLAHLFEHLMFKGSRNVPDGEHFRLLQRVGADVNGSTTEDRTNYYEVVPSEHLELPLILEADRMGQLLPTLSEEKLNNQRDVVKNERRQHYDNQPYGTARETILKALYPETHPYQWPVIGHMKDLDAATLDDVVTFFQTYYAPNNACIVIAGDVEEDHVLDLVKKHFGDIPSGPPVSHPLRQHVTLNQNVQIVLDDNVHLPRLYLTWPSAPWNTSEDAVLDVLTDILSLGKNSRLYRSLVFEHQIAQSVTSYQHGSEIGGVVTIQVTAKPHQTLSAMNDAVSNELNAVFERGVTQREVERSLNGKRAAFLHSLASMDVRANGLATYQTLAGDAGRFPRYLEWFAHVTPESVQDAARRFLSQPHIALSVVPPGGSRLALQTGGSA